MMPDREKVIKWLDVCKTADRAVGLKEDYPCRECPYQDSPRCMRELVADALDLLKKQKVKTVQRIMKTEENGTYFTMIWYECEECGHKINGDDCFCAGCGREVDRSEVIHDM